VAIVVPIFIFPFFFEIPAIAFLGVWVIFQLQELSTAAVFGSGSNSAWWAHLGGFVVGAVLHPFFVANNVTVSDSEPGHEEDMPD